MFTFRSKPITTTSLEKCFYSARRFFRQETSPCWKSIQYTSDNNNLKYSVNVCCRKILVTKSFHKKYSRLSGKTSRINHFLAWQTSRDCACTISECCIAIATFISKNVCKFELTKSWLKNIWWIFLLKHSLMLYMWEMKYCIVLHG